MSSYYGVIFPEFWTGTTGRELRAHGKDAQLIGLYLATNRHANMLGLYRLRIDDVRHETGLGVKAIAKGLQAAQQTDYARYDAATEFTWVRQMARFRLGLKAGEGLREGDKRALAISRIYHALESNPFLGEFFDVNRRMLPLGKRRESAGLVVPFSGDYQIEPHREPHRRGFQGGSPDTESVTEIRDQDQKQKKAAAAPRLNQPREDPNDNLSIITKIAHEAIDMVTAESGDLTETVKSLCSIRGIDYDSGVVCRAIESAQAQRKARAS